MKATVVFNTDQRISTAQKLNNQTAVLNVIASPDGALILPINRT
jgi:hypothetical protein